ncbi:MAG: glycosyltransferase family 4 protein [Candidatus Methanoperedens sp.]|nr:glycosyltransferase family 4 protein [Candidatus Methanoperedens sp.]MCZ7371197.1 glycosyltransferase family 4 protein [Candidatus Methanoperedens sp.]
MNICIFAKGLPVHITGGMEIHVQSLVDGLIKRQHKVTVITTRHPLGIKKEEKGNLKIYYVGDKSLKCTARFYEESLELFEKLNYEERFDIVHSQSTSGYGFARFCHNEIPFIVTFQGTTLNEIISAINTKSIKGFIIALYIFYNDFLINHNKDDKITSKRASKIIAVSNELKEDLKKQYNIPEEKFILIQNGIDVDTFRPDLEVSGLKEKYQLQNKKIILSIGVMTGQKGHDLLIRVMPELLKEDREIKLVLVGYGPAMENLKKMAQELKVSDHVVFTGKVSHEELKFYYNIADVFAFPTLRVEAGPLVIPEAMACERPVIASRIGGIPTVIENYIDGILIQPGNLRELKEKILEVLKNEELGAKLGKNARRKIMERYSVDRMVDDTIKVYEKALGK